MRVKKYQAVDMPEALKKIKEELGPEAVILSTRQIKPGKGVFGMLGRPVLEVTAAADLDRQTSTARQQPSVRPPPRPSDATRGGTPDHGPMLVLQADLDSLREELMLLGRRPRPSPSDALQADVKALAEKVDRLVEQTARFDRMRLSPALRRIHDHLESIDLDGGLASRILSFLQDKVDAGAVGAGREVEALRELVVRTVRVSGDLASDQPTPRVVALVGPTGVGKTTTVAKLAARFALQESTRVGLITLDTFRIAAVEQLKTYANIMAVPIRVALDAEAFRRAVEELAGRDLIFVDTAGQSPRDEASLAQLLSMFPPEMAIEVHLVLSVTTRSRDLDRILRHYQPAKASRLLLTKLDETGCYGPLLGLPIASRLPLSYLTTGQNVPDDIEQASARSVADYVLRELGTA